MSTWRWAVVEASLSEGIGSEQKGTRPVLVVSNEEFNQALTNVTVLPLTSTKRHLYPAEVLLPQKKAGQPMESIVMAHQVRTISKRRLGRIHGYLSDPELQRKVVEAIKDHFDIGREG